MFKSSFENSMNQTIFNYNVGSASVSRNCFWEIYYWIIFGTALDIIVCRHVISSSKNKIRVQVQYSKISLKFQEFQNVWTTEIDLRKTSSLLFGLKRRVDYKLSNKFSIKMNIIEKVQIKFFRKIHFQKIIWKIVWIFNRWLNFYFLVYQISNFKLPNSSNGLVHFKFLSFGRTKLQ